MSATKRQHVDEVLSEVIRAHQISSDEIRDRVLKLAEHIEVPGRFNEDLRRGFGTIAAEFMERIVSEVKEKAGIKIGRSQFAEFVRLDLTILNDMMDSKGLTPNSSRSFGRLLIAFGINQEDLSVLIEKFYPVAEDSELAKLLRTLRGGVTREELSERSGVPERTIEKIERGKTKHPTPKVLRRIADALEVGDDTRDNLLFHASRP